MLRKTKVNEKPITGEILNDSLTGFVKMYFFLTFFFLSKLVDVP